MFMYTNAPMCACVIWHPKLCHLRLGQATVFVLCLQDTTPVAAWPHVQQPRLSCLKKRPPVVLFLFVRVGMTGGHACCKAKRHSFGATTPWSKCSTAPCLLPPTTCCDRALGSPHVLLHDVLQIAPWLPADRDILLPSLVVMGDHGGHHSCDVTTLARVWSRS